MVVKSRKVKMLLKLLLNREFTVCDDGYVVVMKTQGSSQRIKELKKGSDIY